MSFAVKSRGRSPRQTWACAYGQHGRAPMPPPFPQVKDIGGSSEEPGTESPANVGARPQAAWACAHAAPLSPRERGQSSNRKYAY